MNKVALYLCGVLHGIGLLISVVNIVYQILFIQNSKANRKKIGVTDKIVIGWSAVVFCNSAAYFLNAWSGFERSAGTIDGKLGSPPTALCTIQSVLVTGFSMMNSGYTLIMSLNIYLPIVRGWKPREMEAVEMWFHVYPLTIGVIFAIITAAMTTAGPLSFWCWIICEEAGVPSANMNPGKCWTRILTMYGPLILSCVAVLCMLLPLVKILLTHFRKATTGSTATSGGGEGAKKGFQNTVIFLVLYSGIIIGASAGRVKGALAPLTTAGDSSVGITEFAAALIPMTVIGIFASAKWFNPFGKPQSVSVISVVTVRSATQKSTPNKARRVSGFSNDNKSRAKSC
jgi:hypothetical protein